MDVVTEEAVAILDVQPGMAAAWLDRNIENNRPISKRVLDRYMTALRLGHWHFTGEAIKFDTNDRLIDGQHRLLAIKQTGIAARLLVVSGISVDALPFLDGGKTRSDGDAYQIAKLADGVDAKALQSAVNSKLAWDGGQLVHAGSHRSTVSDRGSKLEWLRRNQDFRYVAARARQIYSRGLRLPGGIIAVALYEMRRIDEEQAEEFFDRIVDLNFDGASQLRTLVKRIQQEREQHKVMRDGLALFMLFRTWNAWRDGETLLKLQTGSETSGWGQIPIPH